MLQTFAVVELAVCWIAWCLAFVVALRRAGRQEKVVRAPESRWGIILQTAALALLFVPVEPAGFAKTTASLVASMVLGPPGVALSWAATRHLGKQWRYEAALSADHKLIQTGPYGWVRHPIYLAIMLMLLATGTAVTWWPVFAGAMVVFLAGTEIRVRAEDRLLAERFGEAFAKYRSRVRGYIPFVR